MVFMWIDTDGFAVKVYSTPDCIKQSQSSKLHAYFRVSLQDKDDSAVTGEQAPRPFAAEVHKKADENFRGFKLSISQHKDKKAVLHEVASFSQLESACLKPSDEDGTTFVREPEGRLKSHHKFYLSVLKQRTIPRDRKGVQKGFKLELKS